MGWGLSHRAPGVPTPTDSSSCGYRSESRASREGAQLLLTLALTRWVAPGKLLTHLGLSVLIYIKGLD